MQSQHCGEEERNKAPGAVCLAKKADNEAGQAFCSFGLCEHLPLHCLIISLVVPISLCG